MSPSGPSPSPSRNPPVSPARDQRGASRAAAVASLASLDAANPSQSLSEDGDGPSPNGPSLSGLSLNGPSPNGPSPNGPSLNLNRRESLARDRRDPREASLAVAASLASQDAPSLNQSPSGPPGPYLSGPRGLSLNLSLSLSHLARAAREARVPREARDPREARVQRVPVENGSMCMLPPNGVPLKNTLGDGPNPSLSQNHLERVARDPREASRAAAVESLASQAARSQSLSHGVSLHGPSLNGTQLLQLKLLAPT